MAIVGSMVEGSLTRTITNVKVTKMRDQDLCEVRGREREGKKENERGWEGGWRESDMAWRLQHGTITEDKLVYAWSIDEICNNRMLAQQREFLKPLFTYQPPQCGCYEWPGGVGSSSSCPWP
jgi:hypothetical protein